MMLAFGSLSRMLWTKFYKEMAERFGSVTQKRHMPPETTHRNDLNLAGPLVDALVHGRPRVALRGRPAELRGEVDVDREEPGARRRLPLRDERLSAGVPSGIRWVDAAGVEAARQK